MKNLTVKQFYDQIQFPGVYTMQELAYHIPNIRNSYLSTIDKHIVNRQNILDIGCGTGLISNLFAMRYNSKKFVAVL